MKNKFLHIFYLLQTLTVFNAIKKDKIVNSLYRFGALCANDNIGKKMCLELLEIYSNICSSLYEDNASLSDYLYKLLLKDENVFTKACALNKYHELPDFIINAAKQDIKTVNLLAEISSDDITNFLVEYNQDFVQIKDSLPSFSNMSKYTEKGQFGENSIQDFVDFYLKNGTGIYSEHYSFRVNNDGKIVPVINQDTVKMNDLKLYESQKQKAQDNIVAFLAGNTYNNVLLYGDRGTGKSSCVKAIANEYSQKGLRIIQFEKNKLKYLGDIMQVIAENPLKFLIFIDDLTFNEDDTDMNTLKAVLEGSVCAQPKNTVIYATSNRRHIVKETFSAREGDELHREDTIDELMSLSDRFGLMITYQMPSRENFFEIAKQIVKDRGITEPFEEITKGLEKFALLRGYRSPRIVHQYLDFTYNL